MRNAFADELTQIAAADERVVLLSGDIGNRLFDTYKSLMPGRFYNCGVAEANMVGMAAGMAICGLRPFTYTIAPFTTTRCIEQIRLDVCYHGLPVVIVGVGAGLSYAELGGTHQSCEDIAMLRPLPGMTILCPCDPLEVRLALCAAMEHDGPVYLRLGKKGEPAIHTETPRFEIGKAIQLRRGKDICLIGTGNIMNETIRAAELLEAGGVSAAVVDMHTVKPLDTEFLAEAFESYPVVVTAEEHSLQGGFGSSVAEWLADGPTRRAKFLRFGTPDRFMHVAAKQNEARREFGIAAEDIAEKSMTLLNDKKAESENK